MCEENFFYELGLLCNIVGGQVGWRQQGFNVLFGMQ